MNLRLFCEILNLFVWKAVGVKGEEEVAEAKGAEEVDRSSPRTDDVSNFPLETSRRPLIDVEGKLFSVSKPGYAIFSMYVHK